MNSTIAVVLACALHGADILRLSIRYKYLGVDGHYLVLPPAEYCWGMQTFAHTARSYYLGFTLRHAKVMFVDCGPVCHVCVRLSPLNWSNILQVKTVDCSVPRLSNSGAGSLLCYALHILSLLHSFQRSVKRARSPRTPLNFCPKIQTVRVHELLGGAKILPKSSSLPRVT